MLIWLVCVCQETMTTEAQKTETTPAAPAAAAAATSCRKNKRDDATFLEDLKDHIGEFMSAPMDEHVACFKRTMNKMFNMTKAVAKRDAGAGAADGVESSLALQTTVSN
ncbi:hypothetical protein Tsubulata_040141 [Turnera subulata]|uniref:Uncharacterized protein n=1 Tax=Turnera subulata TaxID=218843 RepID=A0A9Q0G5E2_9ROSI|nr:hypothetical protein Tsubulata_040141 [Turnera subulata]